jgi:hypothetical protein
METRSLLRIEPNVIAAKSCQNLPFPAVEIAGGWWSSGDVLAMVVVMGMRLLAIGVALGLVASFNQHPGAVDNVSAFLTLSIVRRTSLSEVRQLQTLILIARRPCQVVPVKNASPD